MTLCLVVKKILMNVKKWMYHFDENCCEFVFSLAIK